MNVINCNHKKKVTRVVLIIFGCFHKFINASRNKKEKQSLGKTSMCYPLNGFEKKSFMVTNETTIYDKLTIIQSHIVHITWI